MRNNCFTLLSLSAFVVFACGCHQTTGPGATGAFGPLQQGSLSSGSLSPVTPGQTPSLGPFGGTTRVTPPPTGSLSSPNNYMGGVAPTSGYAPINSYQPSASMNVAPQNSYHPDGGAGNFDSFTSQGSQAISQTLHPIGSGVQPASWTETGTSVSNAGPLMSNQQTSSQARDIRAGGMGVIDLTGAPNPPGYHGQNYQGQNFSPQAYQSPQVNYAPSPVISPSMVALPETNSAFQQIGQNRSAAFQTVQTPQVQFPSTSPQFEPRAGQQATLPAAQTATRPVNAGNSLNWRRPGSQF